MKLTFSQVNELTAALTHLGATYNRVIQEGGRETSVAVPYKFGAKSSAVRGAASRNLRLLRPFADEYTERRNELLKEVSDGRGTIGDDEKELLARFNLELHAIDKTEIGEELLLLPIAEADLDIDKNPIPPHFLAVLAQLEPAAPKPTSDA